MTTDAYERLLAEEIPTGSFGGTRTPKHTATHPTLAALHRAELEAALNQDRTRRHLTAVPAQHPTDTTRSAA